jgi:hypothetical protein
MDDYGRGGVLGTATVLPATSATVLWFGSRTNEYVIYGLLALSMLSFLVSLATISRFLRNRN